MLSVGSFGNWQPEFIRIKHNKTYKALEFPLARPSVGETFGPRSVMPVPFVVNVVVLAKLRFFS